MTVVISHLNSARTIARCISHLQCQDYPRELTRVIVVDGGSTDGSREIVASIQTSNLDLVVKPGLSEAEGQSEGVRLADSEVVMFTNSDVYVPPAWVSMHVNRLLRGYDLVGGKVFWGGDKYSFAWNMPTPKTPQFIQQQGMGLGFSNCSVRRELVVRSGGIRNMISQQDTDFAFRVVRSGGKMILDPAILVYHDHPLRSFKASFWRSYVYGLNHVIVMRAVYGRVVMGSGHPAMISIIALLREWLTISGVRAYRQHRGRAEKERISPSLLDFLFIRLFSTKLPQMLGGLVGALMKKASFTAVANSHKVSRV